MKNLFNIYVSITLILTVIISAGGSVSLSQQANAQNAEENKNYILVFGQRTVGNIDNSTKIVSAIVGHDSVKIQEEFLEELSLAPSQQLEEQIEKVVSDGISGAQCNTTLATQEGVNVNVDCISSGNNIVWFIHPAK